MLNALYKLGALYIFYVVCTYENHILHQMPLIKSQEHTFLYAMQTNQFTEHYQRHIFSAVIFCRQVPDNYWIHKSLLLTGYHSGETRQD